MSDRLPSERVHAHAAAELFPIVYGKLREIASQRMARERGDHTVQPTALVHEAWLLLVARDDASFSTRARFLAAASQAMRRVLVEHARARGAHRRVEGRERLTIDTSIPDSDHSRADLLDVDTAMTALSQAHPRAGRVAELRWFGGASIDEAAIAMGLTPRQVKRDSELARAWLQRALRDLAS